MFCWGSDRESTPGCTLSLQLVLFLFRATLIVETLVAIKLGSEVFEKAVLMNLVYWLIWLVSEVPEVSSLCRYATLLDVSWGCLGSISCKCSTCRFFKTSSLPFLG